MDDGEVVLGPARIVGAGNGTRVDVIPKVAAAKVDLKEVSPMVVIVGGEI